MFRLKQVASQMVQTLSGWILFQKYPPENHLYKRQVLCELSYHTYGRMDGRTKQSVEVDWRQKRFVRAANNEQYPVNIRQTFNKAAAATFIFLFL